MDNDINTALNMSEEEKTYLEMNQSINDLKNKRSEIINSLIGQLQHAKLDFANDKPRTTEVKLALYKTVDDLLKSQEALHLNKVKVQLQKKSEATNDNVKQLAIEILKNTSMNQTKNTPVSTSNTDDKIIEEAFSNALANTEELEDIKDDELEIE